MARDPKTSSSTASIRPDREDRPLVGHDAPADASDFVHGESGYRKPPERGRWKKGQSGNRAGRKKGSKNKRTIIIELMEQKLGRKIEDISKLSRYEGMLLKGIQKALSGDAKAMAFILRRYDDAEALQSKVAPVASEQDELVYSAFVEKLKRELWETGK